MREWVLALMLAGGSAGCVGREAPSGRESDWLAQAHSQIAAREYRATENGSGLQAPNRAHNLRTYFEQTGIRVHDRTAGGSPELVQLALASVGRRDTPAAIEPGAAPVANENRVEIHRPGLVEWYVNSPVGLEQGFTLAARPNGEGPLVVELAVAGARPALRGDAIVFDTGVRKLRYGALVANDSRGETLTAHFELAGADRLRIVVDDGQATYPLVIDPLLTETDDTQLESDQASAALGRVGGAGDVNGDGYADVIVGAPLYDGGLTDEGAAFIFLGGVSGIADANPLGAATQLESNQAGAQLGRGLASAGDVNGDGYGDVIVSAVNYDAGQGVGEGAAFIFHGSATGIADGDPSSADTQLESNQASARLGFSAAGAGDVNGDGYADVIVGATLYDAGQTDEGAAFVFYSSGTSGIADSHPGTLGVTRLESDQASASMGVSVAGAGDVNSDGYADVIVGASTYDAGQTDEGAAFVFYSSGTSGIASSNPGTLGVTQLESNQASAALGGNTGVAGAGDVNGDGYADVIVGAGSYDAGETDEGAAFVFLGSGGGIANSNPGTLGVTRLESDQASSFLASVAGAGDVNGDGYSDVIVGASGYDADQTDEGAAFVFLGSDTGIADADPATAAAQLESNQGSAGLGGNGGVAGAGDVNGDGYADVIVGASAYDAGQTDEGAAFVYLGGAEGIGGLTAAAFILIGEPNTVAGAGDVNGDGYADVIVGAPEYDAGQSYEGAAFVFHGSATGIATSSPSGAAAQLESNQAFALLGAAVAGAGDVNGDGYADVIVGSPFYDSGQSDEGAAFVFHGSATGIANGNPGTAPTQLESDQATAFFSRSVAGAGDVNGDGYADVIVGVQDYDAGQPNEGAAFVFLGSASGIADGNPTTAPTQLESNTANGELGRSVAGAGDVNGDGYGDVIVGSQFSNGESGEGAAFVFHGSATGIADGNPATAPTQLESNQASTGFGRSVSGAGDTNGDGYADVIVGATGYDNGETDEGAAFTFHGSSTGIADGNPATSVAQLESNQATANFGLSVGGAGDVNGDGYADVIVGAPNFDTPESLEGAAFVFHGGAAGISDGTPANAATAIEAFNMATTSLGLFVASAGDVNGDGHADVIVSAAADAWVFAGDGRPVLARQYRGTGNSLPVQPFGLAYSTTAFAAELHASHPAGSGRVKIEFQACPSDGPPASPFGDASCTTLVSPTWIAVNDDAPEALIYQTFSGLTNNTLYRWRARVLHAPATGAIPTNPAHGPWRRPTAQSLEADIRLPEPGLLVSLACGVTLLAALALGRRTGSVRTCA